MTSKPLGAFMAVSWAAPKGEARVEVVARGNTRKRLHRPQRVVGHDVREVAQLHALERLGERLVTVVVEDRDGNVHRLRMFDRVLAKADLEVFRGSRDRFPHDSVTDGAHRDFGLDVHARPWKLESADSLC